jgi:hypothetical protein
MIRVILGSAVAAVAMLILGFLFFASGMENIGSSSLDDSRAAAVQQVLAANLDGTGTYQVPSPEESAAQTVMYGKGPIATVHYNIKGFAAEDATMMVVGLVFNFVIALLIGAALISIDRRVPDFGSRARVAGLIALAATAFIHLGEPIYWHHDWRHFLYLFFADAVMLVAGGVIVAWFLPKGGIAVGAVDPERSEPAA